MAENNKIRLRYVKRQIHLIVDKVKNFPAERYLQKWREILRPLTHVAISAHHVDWDACGFKFFVAALCVDVPCVEQAVAFLENGKPALTEYAVGVRYNAYFHLLDRSLLRWWDTVIITYFFAGTIIKKEIYIVFYIYKSDLMVYSRKAKFIAPQYIK